MDTSKNIALEPELFEELREQAQAEGTTADQLASEAARKLLEARRTLGGLRSFVASNRRDALARGLKESDVPRLIAESRVERRGR